ncbi:Na+/H+ antiporter NhaA [Enterobacter hormaechei]
MAAVAIAVLALLNVFNVRRTGIYILVGMVLWTAVLKSGVHATLAGVIVGFFSAEGTGRQIACQTAGACASSVGGFLILPLFAFANAVFPWPGYAGQTHLCAAAGYHRRSVYW